MCQKTAMSKPLHKAGPNMVMIKGELSNILPLTWFDDRWIIAWLETHPKSSISTHQWWITSSKIQMNTILIVPRIHSKQTFVSKVLFFWFLCLLFWFQMSKTKKKTFEREKKQFYIQELFFKEIHRSVGWRWLNRDRNVGTCMLWRKNWF